MKYVKSAAIVAGSVVALGAAAPAFASNPTPSRMHLNGAPASTLGKRLEGAQIVPLVKAVKDTTDTVRASKNLLKGNQVDVKRPQLLGGLALGK